MSKYLKSIKNDTIFDISIQTKRGGNSIIPAKIKMTTRIINSAKFADLLVKGFNSHVEFLHSVNYHSYKEESLINKIRNVGYLVLNLMAENKDVTIFINKDGLASYNFFAQGKRKSDAIFSKEQSDSLIRNSVENDK